MFLFSASHRCTVLILAAALAWSATARAEEPGGIHVSGVGEVRVVPDMARVTLEVRREGEDAAALKRELDAATEAVLSLTRDLDIAERDVTAAAVQIFPRYRPDDGAPAGVIASRSVEVTVRDLEDLGALINGALERGANGVGGVQLDASNRPDLERQALDLAIDDAVHEARQMAKRFDVTLGALTDASTSSHAPQPLMMEAAAASRFAKDSVAPGELSIRRDVQATFSIRP